MLLSLTLSYLFHIFSLCCVFLSIKHYRTRYVAVFILTSFIIYVVPSPYQPHLTSLCCVSRRRVGRRETALPRRRGARPPHAFMGEHQPAEGGTQLQKCQHLRDLRGGYGASQGQVSAVGGSRRGREASCFEAGTRLGGL